MCLTALRFAALRGVEVRLLVPGRADHYITYFAAMAYFDDSALCRGGGLDV